MKTRSFSIRKFQVVGLVMAVVGSCWVVVAQEPDQFAERNARDAAIAARQNAAATSYPNLPGTTWSQPASEPAQRQFGTFQNQAGPSTGLLRQDSGYLNSPESLELNKQIAVLSKQLRDAESDDDKTTIKEQLKTELEKQYDLYLAQHEKPLQELEARLDKLRAEFEWRKSAKDDLVKLRLDTIWYDSQGLGWPGAKPSQVSLTHPMFTSETTITTILR